LRKPRKNTIGELHHVGLPGKTKGEMWCALNRLRNGRKKKRTFFKKITSIMKRGKMGGKIQTL